MKQITIIIGLFCLVCAGCVQISRLAIWNFGDAQQIVVWNGRTCTEEWRPNRQITGMTRLTRIIASINSVEMDVVYLDGVEPSRMNDLLTRGETMVLPSGRLVAFPPMESGEVVGIIKSGNACFPEGDYVPVNVKDAEGLPVQYRIDRPKERRGVDFDFAVGGANYK